MTTVTLNNWSKLADRLDRNWLRRAIAKELAGETRTIQIGRSRNVAGLGTNTPIKLVDGDSAPELRGQPCLGTMFRNGSFRKIIYTPSTLHVVVGRDWRPTNGQRHERG
jgi:hypothetical protein